MSNTFVPRIGQKVTIGQPADNKMNNEFIGQTGLVMKRTGHHSDLSPELDLWSVKFPSGKEDAFYTEELIPGK